MFDIHGHKIEWWTQEENSFVWLNRAGKIIGGIKTLNHRGSAQRGFVGYLGGQIKEGKLHDAVCAFQILLHPSKINTDSMQRAQERLVRCAERLDETTPNWDTLFDLKIEWKERNAACRLDD